MPEISPEFPEKLQQLFLPKRYKVLYGGRGAGRSWGVARALLIIGVQRKIRVLCARELQNSISESVHKVLSDQIQMMGLDKYYEIQRDVIRGRNGTTFSFEGIKNNTNKIRSYEGIDYCWVEEAANVTKDSWQILIPTIRKEVCGNGHQIPVWVQEDLEGNIICPECKSSLQQSEIWMTFNPDLEEDYTFQRFVVGAEPERMFVIRMTYSDNPWFPRVLREEMESARKVGLQKGHEQDYADYLNVWEGHCKQVLTGTVYAREILRAQEEKRICSVSWEKEWPVDTFWDLGRADNTAIWFGQRVAMQYRVLAYYEASGQDITHFIKELQSRAYTYGMTFLPHDAKAKRLGSKRTIQETLQQAGFKVQIVPKLSISDGINAARMIFQNCWFDELECKSGLLALRNYKYKVINGKLSNEPLHDWASDGADAFRYMGISLKGPKTESRVGDYIPGSLAARSGEMIQDIQRRASSSLGWLR